MEEVIAGGLWPDWAILVIMMLGVISYIAYIYRLPGSGSWKTIVETDALEKENNAMLKEMLAYTKPAPGMMEHTAMLKEIAAGQAEIIRLLEAVVPAGMAAAGVQSSAAARGNGRGIDTGGVRTGGTRPPASQHMGRPCACGPDPV